MAEIPDDDAEADMEAVRCWIECRGTVHQMHRIEEAQKDPQSRIAKAICRYNAAVKKANDQYDLEYAPEKKPRSVGASWQIS